jgi:hypothetical protein
MKPSDTIFSNLISCRNILLGGHASEDVLNSLAEVLRTLDSISVPSSKALVGYCTSQAIEQIKHSNFVSAGLILNLIHNLPLDDASENKWDIDYFLSMELTTFLEHFDEIEAARNIVLKVCSEIAVRYLKNCSVSVTS